MLRLIISTLRGQLLIYFCLLTPINITANAINILPLTATFQLPLTKYSRRIITFSREHPCYRKRENTEIWHQINRSSVFQNTPTHAIQCQSTNNNANANPKPNPNVTLWLWLG